MSSMRGNRQQLRKYFKDLASNAPFMLALRQGKGPGDIFNIPGVSGCATTMATLLLLSHRHTECVPGTLASALRDYSAMKQLSRTTHRKAKRSIAAALGLHAVPLTMKEMHDTQVARVVVRDRFEDAHFARHLHLVDVGNEDLVKDGVLALPVPVGQTWYTVEPDENVIFMNTTGSIELVVIRGRCHLRPDLLEYANRVVDEAVNDRRGVRPNHAGTMVQFGWNAGSRTARVFGLVNNLLKKNLPLTARQAKDTRALGILALTWNILLASMPAEVGAACLEAIEAANLPPMSSLGNTSSSGYTLDLPGGPLHFSTANRAPSEGYLTQNYEAPIHTDRLFAPFGFSWGTLHEKEDRCDVSGGRSPGGNFVDVSLRVVVKGANDTLMCTRPSFKHGTTMARAGLRRQGTSITFSDHIREAFDNAVGIDGDVKAMVERLAKLAV